MKFHRTLVDDVVESTDELIGHLSGTVITQIIGRQPLVSFSHLTYSVLLSELWKLSELKVTILHTVFQTRKSCTRR